MKSRRGRVSGRDSGKSSGSRVSGRIGGRVNKNKSRRRPRVPEIQHHHMLLRMEMKRCPQEDQRKEAEELIYKIVRDIGMKLLDKPHVYYVQRPVYNEGMTAIAPIQTSHIAFHFWKNPERRILKSAESRCLLEFDIYTCGTLSAADIRQTLHHLTAYQPTHVDMTILNRKWSLAIERHERWSTDYGTPWVSWVESLTLKMD
jgi:S-adenosylmethionine/arginine decarboxylase-like enzyme